MSPRRDESLLIFFHGISRHVDDVNWRNSHLKFFVATNFVDIYIYDAK